MLRFVIQKIRSKKWLNLCLFFGIVLIVSVFSCHPMLEKGAGNQVIQDDFEVKAKNNQVFPAVISKKDNYNFNKKDRSLQAVYGVMDSNEKKWRETLGIENLLTQQYTYFLGNTAKTQYSDRIQFFSVGILNEMDSHIQIVKGESLEKAVGEENVFPCIISEKAMDMENLVLGERITISIKNNNQEKNIEFVVVGICKEKYDADNYWYISLSELYKTLFITEETFDTLICDYEIEKINYEQNTLLNYRQINYDNAKKCSEGIEKCLSEDEELNINFRDTLTKFQNAKRTISTLLWALEIPCIVLLLIFVHMVSSQIINSEEGEIAALRSRGVSVRQIIALYFLNSLILSLVGTVTGMLFGFIMCKCAASTDAFLTFVKKDISNYTFTWEVLLYALVACIIVIIFITVPITKRAGITIVTQKNIREDSRRKSLWEKIFLDIILLSSSLYLLYNYRKQINELSESIINKESVDPMIFLVSSLFIFACSLIFIRLLKYVVYVIDRVGKKRWSPSMYVSFLQIGRNYYKQGFLCMFLIMTISTGIFNSNMARTINENSERRIRYNVGADVRVQENWKLFTTVYGDATRWSYEEKSFDAFYSIEKAGLCDKATKVITDEQAVMRAGNTNLENSLLMGINTKEFGETAELQDGLNDTHWFNALNALAADVDGAIISRNAAEALGVGVGDALQLIRYSPVSEDEPEKMGNVEFIVSMIVDCFPGYERYSYIEDDNGKVIEKENYLIVTNYAMLVSSFGQTPYSVWMKTKDKTTSQQLMSYLEERQVDVKQIIIAEELVKKNKNSAMVQITNGMFTMSFIITLIICSVGFLIYWIMSIKSRQMVFGVYRAMGMSMREVYIMLLNEHFFSTILSIAMGGVVGTLGTFLFVKLITIVYLPQKHNIDIAVYMYGTDMVKLFAIIFIVVAVCFVILQRIICKLKIDQALKM